MHCQVLAGSSTAQLRVGQAPGPGGATLIQWQAGRRPGPGHAGPAQYSRRAALDLYSSSALGPQPHPTAAHNTQPEPARPSPIRQHRAGPCRRRKALPAPVLPDRVGANRPAVTRTDVTWQLPSPSQESESLTWQGLYALKSHESWPCPVP